MQYVIPKLGSRRLEDACEFHGDSYLTRTFSGAADSVQKATVSVWIKRARLANFMFIVAARESVSPLKEYGLYLTTSGTIKLTVYDTSSYVVDVTSTETVFDHDWHHIVAVLDLANAVQAERAKIYLDNAEVTYAAPVRPSNQTTEMNGLCGPYLHEVGRNIGAVHYVNGVMADFNLVCDQVLSPDDFGTTVDGNWVWKNYIGTHGTNGARLRFLDTNDSLGSDDAR